uniref:Probable protein-export membrane protein SecG n=1 Tax=Schimmelmannia schousboei TaxID=173468 RepID=A0A1C9C8I5_9FLOR|nr:hypothetical protein Schim_016 [Schimmelmannia schousboei]AOM64697.1 hypothetical protein Schim_016 [Schimmelmannia schousboei]
MKVIWYTVNVTTILLILINSPKATGLGNFVNQGKVMNFTRSTQKRLQIITIISIVLFFFFTIFSILY